jgi:hypothetical protein
LAIPSSVAGAVPPPNTATWTTNFHGWNAGNFGWGSDTVQNILWRLENGELAGVHPKVIVLLAGTNNLKPDDTGDRAEAKIAEVTAGIRAILNSVQRQAPAATVILTGVLPRNSPGEDLTLMPTIRRLNARLAGFADGQRIRYLDLDDRLADRDGKLLAGEVGRPSLDERYFEAQTHQPITKFDVAALFWQASWRKTVL